MKNDPMGDRFKRYEAVTQQLLPRRTYTIIRVDGKAFHTVLSRAEKPFDAKVAEAMDQAAKSLVNAIQGAFLAYTQSDEISVVIYDFANIETQAWFDGNVQKMVSISAAIATRTFGLWWPGGPALFDSRVFTIPDPVEVANYLIWRQRDCVRNAILGLAQAKFGPARIHGVDTTNLLHMLDDEGIHWAEMPGRFTHGALATKEQYYAGDESCPPFEGTEGWRTRTVVTPVDDGWTVNQLLPMIPQYDY